MATIVILEHQLQPSLGSHYILHELAQRWQLAGHSVLWHYGTDDPPAGDLAILHVDLTVIPERYRKLLGRYARVLNAATLSIAKSQFSRLIVQKGSAFEGPVIVKTDANFGGKVDRALRQLSAAQGLPDDIAATPTLADYPIVDNPAQLPESAWTTPGLIVEKFMPERDEAGYYLRVWTFFGSRERSSRYLAATPVIKAANMLERSPVTVPSALRALRRKLGFDYGKFDYVQSGGSFYLLDINRCPGAPAGLLARPDMAGFLDEMALGIDDYF